MQKLEIEFSSKNQDFLGPGGKPLHDKFLQRLSSKSSIFHEKSTVSKALHPRYSAKVIFYGAGIVCVFSSIRLFGFSSLRSSEIGVMAKTNQKWVVKSLTRTPHLRLACLVRA